LFDQEETWVLLLNTKHKITREAMVYRGTVNAAYIRVAEFFKEAVEPHHGGQGFAGYKVRAIAY